MTDLVTALAAPAAGIAGIFLGQWVEARRQRRERMESRADELRAQRGEAYRRYVREAHLAAHLIGRTSPGCPEPLESSPEVLARVDSEVARRQYELALFATQGTLDAARAVRVALHDFRRSVESGATYEDEQYLAALRIYQNARTRFLDLARTEVLTLD